MQTGGDSQNVLNVLLTEALKKITQLMEGFYRNTEDGLFEIAYASEDGSQRQNIVKLMRELRFQRDHLMKSFDDRLVGGLDEWLGGSDENRYPEEHQQATYIAQRCASHFSFVLQSIAERIAHGAGRIADRNVMPVSPQQISYHFIMSCRSIQFEPNEAKIVEDLFHRFVLDKLGDIYGSINHKLIEAGYLTLKDREGFSVSTV